MNNRIRKIRKELDLTQTAFAERIGTTANIMTNYETGRRNPSNSVINNICKTFNVNEEWLRNGTGEMFKASPNEELDALASKFGLSHGEYVLIEKFINLKAEKRQVVVEYVLDAAAAMQGEGASPLMPAITADAEAAYIKSRSGSAPNTGFAASNTIKGIENEAANQ